MPRLGSLLAEFRARVYWSLDYLRGGPVRRAYDQLKAIDSLDSRSPQLVEYQEARLRRLLAHANQTTPFYAALGLNRFEEYPVVDKAVIRGQQDSFLSRRFRKSQLVTMATSGSTGTPFVCYQDVRKKTRVNAEVIFYSEKAGYRVGGNLVYLRALTGKSRKSRLLRWLQNETLVDVSRLDDTHMISLLKSIRESSRLGSMLLAYASTYDATRDYFNRNGVPSVGGSRIVGAVSTSEMLFDETRQVIEKAFRCRCFSRYSNQENGVIGQDDIANNVFILNEAHYIVEVLKMDSDVPAPDGEVGRIVVTDLYNYAMPIIRYDTGDIGAISYVMSSGVQKRALCSFGGRRVDMVRDCCGNLLSPHSITNTFWSFPEIRQYQFMQEGQSAYTLRVSADPGFSRMDEVEQALRGLLGAGADIRLEVVDDIPVLASGKRKYIVSNVS